MDAADTAAPARGHRAYEFWQEPGRPSPVPFLVFVAATVVGAVLRAPVMKALSAALFAVAPAATKWTAHDRTRERPVLLSLTNGVVVDGSRRIEREAVTALEGFINVPRFTIQSAGGSITFGFDSWAEMNAALAEMAIPSSRPIRFGKEDSSVIVGADGFRIDRGGGYGGTFVPFAEVVEVVPDLAFVGVRTRANTYERFYIGSLARRLALYIQGSVDQTTDASLCDALSRGERSVAEWTQHLRSLGDEVTSYRCAGVTTNALWSVVDARAASPAERAAAVVALSASLSTAEREHLRSLAGAMLDRPTARVLNCVADGATEPELATALERVS